MHAARTIQLSKRTIMTFPLPVTCFFISVPHFDRQPKDDLGPCDENGNCEQVGDEVRKHAVKYLAHWAPGIARHDEAVQSYRWSDHSDFGGNDLDNAEPERIVTEGLDQRQNDGDGQHKDGDLVHEG